MSTLTSAWREDYESQFPPDHPALRPRPLGADIAHVEDYVKSDEERQVHALIFQAQALAELYAARRLPTDRRDALRAALLAAMRIRPSSPRPPRRRWTSADGGQEVEAFIAKASRASPAIIERVKQAYSP